MVEITDRTIQGRFLLTPSAALNDIALGVLGRAQRLHNVRLFGYVFLSNHVHILAWVGDAQQLSGFMGYFNSNLAREAGRLVQWREKFWSRRYRAIVISSEEGAQRQRLKYVLCHGVKEGLVDDPRDWPGVHAIRPLLEGTPDQGTWFDRIKEYAAGRRGRQGRAGALRHDLYRRPFPAALLGGSSTRSPEEKDRGDRPRD